MVNEVTILSAIADHTSEGFQIRQINSPAALLTIELEEFSRISRPTWCPYNCHASLLY